MIVNKPAIDYLRLTTFVFRHYQQSVWQMVPQEESGERGRWLQYHGTEYGALFHGQGEQGGKTHYMIQVSGSEAHNHLTAFRETRMRCKRIDLQLTLPLPGDYSSRELADSLRYGDWPGRKRGVILYDSGGDDTVYVGSRSSDRFIRVYVKDKSWLRFEVQYGDDRALRCAQVIGESGQESIGGILLAELYKLPDAPYLGEFRSYLSSSKYKQANIKVYVSDGEKIDKLRWLSSLLPTIRRMMYDHDHGHVVSDWIINLANERMSDEKIFME